MVGLGVGVTDRKLRGGVDTLVGVDIGAETTFGARVGVGDATDGEATSVAVGVGEVVGTAVTEVAVGVNVGVGVEVVVGVGLSGASASAIFTTRGVGELVRVTMRTRVGVDNTTRGSACVVEAVDS